MTKQQNKIKPGVVKFVLGLVVVLINPKKMRIEELEHNLYSSHIKYTEL